MTRAVKATRFINAAILLTGLVDLSTTLVWLRAGTIIEANPIMACVLRAGIPAFVIVKLGTLVSYAAVLDWYAQRRGRMAPAIGVFTLLAYWLLYAASFCAVNSRLLFG